jgi:hypothetical protein
MSPSPTRALSGLFPTAAALGGRAQGDWCISPNRIRKDLARRGLALEATHGLAGWVADLDGASGEDGIERVDHGVPQKKRMPLVSDTVLRYVAYIPK